MASYNIICNNPDCADHKKTYFTQRELSDSECCDECGEPVEISIIGNDKQQPDPDNPMIKMCSKCREVTRYKTANDKCNCGGYLKEARVCSDPKCPQKMIPHPAINFCLNSECKSKMIPIPDDSPLLLKDSKIFNDFKKRDGRTCIRFITKYQDLSGSDLSHIVKSAEDFANGTVKSSAGIEFYPKNNGYEIKITGLGSDDVCTWCRSFGAKLYSYTEKEYDGIVRTRFTCDYGY